MFFHFSHSLLKKLKEYKLVKKNLNKRGIEILRNCELLCFINKDKIKKYFEF